MVCLPTPPPFTPPRGKRCSTSSSATIAQDTGSRSSRSTRAAEYDAYVDGKPRANGVRDFLDRARDHAARRCRRRSAGRDDGERPRQPEERGRPAPDPDRGRARVRRLPALPPGRRAGRTPPGGGVVEREHPRSAGRHRTREVRRADRRRRDDQDRRAARASRRRTRSLPRPRASVSTRRGGGVRGRAGRGGGRPRGPLRAGHRSRPRRSGRRAEERTAPTWWSATWQNCWTGVDE